MPSGIKTWLYVYSVCDKRREMNLGIYPEVTLETARDRFDEARKRVKNGTDPMAEKEEAEEARRKAPTVADLVDEYLKKHAMVNKKSWKEDQRCFAKDVLPFWGQRKAADIKKRDVVLLLERIVERGSPIMANNTLEKVRKMFNFAVERDILEFTPCYGVKKPTKQEYKDRVLTDQEIAQVWKGLDSAPMSREMSRILKLILVTAQRPGEVVGMHSNEIAGDWWTIPPERAKNGKTHRVFLTQTAKELIGDKLGYFFESPKKGKPMDGNAVAYSVRRSLEKPEQLQELFEESTGDVEGTSGRRIVMAPWTPHDLRRTAATNMSALGFPDETIDAVLNHVKKGVIAIYNRHSYDKEKQQALEAWEHRLKHIVIGGEVAKVIPLRR
jgi:integrase